MRKAFFLALPLLLAVSAVCSQAKTPAQLEDYIADLQDIPDMKSMSALQKEILSLPAADQEQLFSLLNKKIGSLARSLLKETVKEQNKEIMRQMGAKEEPAQQQSGGSGTSPAKITARDIAESQVMRDINPLAEGLGQFVKEHTENTDQEQQKNTDNRQTPIPEK